MAPQDVFGCSSDEDEQIGMDWGENPQLRISVEKTRAVLGPFIKYPRLEIKYLLKPPFLFVLDIVTHTIKTHGFLNGLYSADEMNRSLLRSSKEKRAHFLRKLVMALRTVSGDAFPDCDWHKLASGKLPLLTNEILHSLANSLAKKMNCALAVKKLNGQIDCAHNFNSQTPKRGLGQTIENFGWRQISNADFGKRKRQKGTYTDENKYESEGSMDLEQQFKSLNL